jgi:hypothetical protein
MPSRFPGMDPYLETPQLWPDLHQSLITYIRDALQPQIRPRYRARIEERLYVVQSSRSIYPDVTVVQHALREEAVAEITSSVKPADLPADTPFTLVLSDDEFREPFIEIIQPDSGQVVTVIEVLSPANKTPGPGRELYRQKQGEVLGSEAHLVEIDLLSQGEHTLALPADRLPLLPPHRYLVSVCRGPEHMTFELYPIPLDKRLPRCRIPLDAPDPDVVLDLPAIFTRCYDNGGYADFIDYQQPSSTPLSDEEQAWVGENVKREA